MSTSIAAYPLKISNCLKGGLFITLLGICLFTRQLTFANTASLDLDNLTSRLAEEIIENASSDIGPSQRILIVNLVDMNQIHCTSRFGLLVAERLRGLLQERGLRVVEVRRADTLKIEKDTGQYILSRDVRELASRVRCTGILAGTYLFHGGRVLINLRLISFPENEIISSANESVIADTFISSLLEPIGYGCNEPKAFIKIKPFVVKDNGDHQS